MGVVQQMANFLKKGQRQHVVIFPQGLEELALTLLCLELACLWISSRAGQLEEGFCLAWARSLGC